MNFSLSENENNLLFNSIPIYPVPLESDNITPLTQSQPAVAEQGLVGSTRSTVIRSFRYTGYIDPIKRFTDEHTRLLRFHVTIYRLDEQYVTIEPVIFDILETDSGKLIILTGGKIPQMDPPVSYPAAQPTQACGTGPFSLLCRLRNFVEAKFSSIAPSRRGGCHGRGGASARQPPFVKGGPAKYSHHAEGVDTMRMPHPHVPSNAIIRSLHFFTISVLVPILVGIAAGLTASMAGLMVGAAVAWFWVKFVRGWVDTARTTRLAAVGAGREFTRCDLAGKEEQWVENAGVRDEKAGYAASVEEREIAEPPPGYVEKE